MRTFMGFVLPADGYGIATRKIGDLLARDGWRIFDMTVGYEERRWQVAGPALAMCSAEWLAHIEAPDGLALYTMFESSKMPPTQVELINRHARAVIVTCDWNVEVFRASGVRAPLSVAGLGVDGGDFPVLTREHAGRPYTFVWSGTPDRRKGWDLAYRAFWQAFRGDPAVRLIMHFRQLPKAIKSCSDGNVELIEGRLSDVAWLELLARADAFVFPSRGEGWGQPPREAAATGLPAIATNWSGLAVGIEQWGIPLRVAGLSPARFGWWAEDVDLGEWAEPDEAHLVELLRWCYEHPEEAAARGAAGAAWLRANATWEQTAGRLEIRD